MFKIPKSLHTLISSLPDRWPWLYDDPWFIRTEENSPFKSSRSVPITWEDWDSQDPPEITHTIYQPINSSCSSARRTTVTGEPGALQLHRPYSHISLKPGDSREPGSHTNQPSKGTQGKLPTTSHTAEKVLGVALEYSTNLNMPT